MEATKIPLWQISLLDANSVEEFLYEHNGLVGVRLHAFRINGEWIVDFWNKCRNFGWGCNKFHTKMYGDEKTLIWSYLLQVHKHLVNNGEPAEITEIQDALGGFENKLSYRIFK